MKVNWSGKRWKQKKRLWSSGSRIVFSCKTLINYDELITFNTLCYACLEGTHLVLSSFALDRTWIRLLFLSLCLSSLIKLLLILTVWIPPKHSFTIATIVIVTVILDSNIINFFFRKLTRGHLGVCEESPRMPCQCLECTKLLSQ